MSYSEEYFAKFWNTSSLFKWMRIVLLIFVNSRKHFVFSLIFVLHTIQDIHSKAPFWREKIRKVCCDFEYHNTYLSYSIPVCSSCQTSLYCGTQIDLVVFCTGAWKIGFCIYWTFKSCFNIQNVIEGNGDSCFCQSWELVSIAKF